MVLVLGLVLILVSGVLILILVLVSGVLILVLVGLDRTILPIPMPNRHTLL